MSALLRSDYKESGKGRKQTQEIIVDSYHADHERAFNDVTVCSNDAGWTDTRPVNTRSTVMAIEHVTSGNGAVGADEARGTEAVTGAVTSGAVTTRVVVAAVRLCAGATGVGGFAGAAVRVHQVVARAAVQTRVTGAFVYVRLAHAA